MISTAIVALSLSVAGAAAAAEKDTPFYQEVSHKSQYGVQNQSAIADWEQLPFEIQGTQQVVFAADRGCFVSLSGGVLYASARKQQYDKLALESPYGAWEELYNLVDAGVAGPASALKLVESQGAGSSSSFFVVTDTNLIGVRMADAASGANATATGSGACGVVQSTNAVLAEGFGGWGGSVSAVASSSTAVWVASTSGSTAAVSGVQAGLTQVSLQDGSTRTLAPYMLNGDSGGVTSLQWVESWGQLFVGTPATFYTMIYHDGAGAPGGAAPLRTEHEWVGGILDSAPLDMAFDATHDALWVAESGALHKLSADGRWWRYGLSQGSPFISNVTSVALSSDDAFVWVGTSAYGLARLHSDADPTPRSAASRASRKSTDGKGDSDPWSWSFYSGNRYVPDNAISSIVTGSTASSSGSAILAVGGTGMGLLDSSQWTLAEKATVYDATQSRHSRAGLVAENALTHYGDVREYTQGCHDNDGLWTSMHAMSEVYRYLATGDEDAKKLAWQAFEGLEQLSIIPGNYPYFPARSFATDAEHEALGGCSGDLWVKSTAVEGYYWKSTTSSDEIDGHLAIYPMIYDHIASSDEERQRAYDLIEGITGGILANDYYLMDPSTGQPTQWGFWNPGEINGNPEHYGERGTNSLGILSYLASAYSVTRDVKYKDAFWDLAVKHNYIGNVKNAKIDAPNEDNHSDNELLFQAYHIMFYALNRLPEDDPLRADVREMVQTAVPSIDRMWDIVGAEMSPLWVAMYGGACGRPVTPQQVSDATWSLRHWALDLIGWPVDNTVRWDVSLSPYWNRGKDDEYMFRSVLPPSERATSKWNTNPYQVLSGSGNNEEAPHIWALPYYMMKYYKLV